MGLPKARGALFGCIHNTDATWGSTSGVMMSWLFWNRALIGFIYTWYITAVLTDYVWFCRECTSSGGSEGSRRSIHTGVF